MHFWLGPAEALGYTAASSVTRRRSSVVERILGKAEVGSSILPGGTIQALAMKSRKGLVQSPPENRTFRVPKNIRVSPPYTDSPSASSRR